MRAEVLRLPLDAGARYTSYRWKLRPWFVVGGSATVTGIIGHELVDTERRNAIARAISTLPEKYRAPLILRDVEGRSYEEIAGILQTNEGTVKSRISRARGFLREKMKAYF